MNRTIKELADELGVSKTAIRKYMTDEFRAAYVTEENGVLYISDDGANQLESLRKLPQTIENQFAETTENSPQTTENAEIIEMLRATLNTLQAQLDEKDKQIAAKDRTIESLNHRLADMTASNRDLFASLSDTTKSLQAAQALHAETMLQLTTEKPEEQKQSFWSKFKKK